MQHLLERLNQVGFERARRAVAALGLSLFVSLFFLLTLNMPPPLVPAIAALALCYGVAFMGVAAEWFWGRWFAIGLGWSGVMMAIAVLAQVGWTPVFVYYGGIHALIILLLSGHKMAERFDLQPAWRERYGMDEFGVARLRKTVTRASASLPSVIFYLLGPKPPENGMLATIALFAAGALTLGGLRGVIRLRSWGVMALAASAALWLGVAFTGPLFGHGFLGAAGGAGRGLLLGLTPGTIALLLTAAVAPFARPTLRYLRRR